MKKSILGLLMVCLIFFVSTSRTILSQDDSDRRLPAGLLFHTADPGPSPDELYYVDPTTLEMEKISTFEEYERPDRLSWSPDGQYFAVVLHSKYTTNSIDQICIYAQDGTRTQCLIVRLWGNSRFFPLVWTTDGKQVLAILTADDGAPELGRIDVSMNQLISETLLILNAQEQLRAISWSFDRTSLAYQTYSDPEETVEPLNLYLLDLHNMEAKALTSQSSLACMSWSSNENQIAVAVDGGISLYDTVGHVISDIQPLYEGSLLLGCPMAWSHDGTHIAFNSVYRPQTAGLFVVELKGSGTTTLLVDNTHPAYSIEWSPDDKYIASDVFYGGGYSEIVVASLDGWTRIYRVENALRGPAWQP